MAKTPTRSTTKRKKTQKGAPGAREALPTDADELLAADAVAAIAESSLAGPEASVADVIQEHVAAPNQEASSADRAGHTEVTQENLEFAIDLVRRLVTSLDFDEMPFARIVGRIIYILTVDGPKPFCKANPIAKVLLAYAPKHVKPGHRSPGLNIKKHDVSRTSFIRVVYDRLNLLKGPKLRMLQRPPVGQGYMLTSSGRFVFAAWPEGIEFEPNNKDLWGRASPTVPRGCSPRRGKGR